MSCASARRALLWSPVVRSRMSRRISASTRRRCARGCARPRPTRPAARRTWCAARPPDATRLVDLGTRRSLHRRSTRARRAAGSAAGASRLASLSTGRRDAGGLRLARTGYAKRRSAVSPRRLLVPQHPRSWPPSVHPRCTPAAAAPDHQRSTRASASGRRSQTRCSANKSSTCIPVAPSACAVEARAGRTCAPSGWSREVPDHAGAQPRVSGTACVGVDRLVRSPCSAASRNRRSPGSTRHSSRDR